MNGTAIPRAQQAEDELKDTILDITSTLLDNYYEERPRSGAFGCDYQGDYDARRGEPTDDDLIPHGSWITGRADGSDGAEKDSGVDYILRKHPNPNRPRDPNADESHYLFGDYGWPRYIDDFRHEIDLYRQALESAVEDDYLDDAHLERYDRAIDRYETALFEDRSDATLKEIATALRENDMDTLRPLLVEDNEDGRVIWQLLFSKNADGDIIENDVRVPVVSERDDLLFAYTDRQFVNTNRRGEVIEEKEYAFGAVIGIDDTEEVFFVHRLQSDSDLRGDFDSDAVKELQEEVGLTEEEVREKQDEMGVSRLTAGKRKEVIESLLADRDFDMDEWDDLVAGKREEIRPDWTVALVKEKMGFDINHDDLVTGDVPLDTTIRVQGDLAFRRHDYRTVFWEYYEEVLEDKLSDAASGKRDYNPLEDDEKEYNPWKEFRQAHPRYEESIRHTRQRNDEKAIDGLFVGYSEGFSVDDDLSTDEMKELQEKVGLTEEEVRDEQERRGINRLIASRRAEIIADLLLERAREWMHENADGMPSRETLEREAEEDAREAFEDVNRQVNLALGNHAVMVGPAREHPDIGFGDRDTLASIVVPDSATLVVWHDEHENAKIDLGPGVYEFRFLEGHEDNWWRPGR